MLIVTLFFISLPFYSSYSDITIDSKNRVLLLSQEERIVEDSSGSVRFSLDSIFAPVSISSSSFSIWVTSISEFKSQKYSLWGELLGTIGIGGIDIDADDKGVLIAGEESYLFQTVSGAKITLTKKKMERCVLSRDSLYLYGNDTIYVFERSGNFVRKKFIPDAKDICIYQGNPCLLFEDSLVLSDTVISFSGGNRVDGREAFVSILTDSGTVYYPPPKKQNTTTPGY